MKLIMMQISPVLVRITEMLQSPPQANGPRQEMEERTYAKATSSSVLQQDYLAQQDYLDHIESIQKILFYFSEHIAASTGHKKTTLLEAVSNLLLATVNIH